MSGLLLVGRKQMKPPITLHVGTGECTLGPAE